MSQIFTDNCFAGSHEAQTDLQNMENNFAALKSMFSGATTPANTVAGMPWFDTTKKVLRVRNTADSAWYGLMHGDTSQKMWVYRNAAMDGWAVDSGVTDTVLALKGGTTYTAGAATAGTWTISGITNANESAHTHQLYAHDHTAATGVASVGGTPESVFEAYSVTGVNTHTHSISLQPSANTTGGVAHTHVASQDATWRVSAAVGTLQYMDL